MQTTRTVLFQQPAELMKSFPLIPEKMQLTCKKNPVRTFATYLQEPPRLAIPKLNRTNEKLL
jgi:hypothetical protein